MPLATRSKPACSGRGNTRAVHGTSMKTLVALSVLIASIRWTDLDSPAAFFNLVLPLAGFFALLYTLTALVYRSIRGGGHSTSDFSGGGDFGCDHFGDGGGGCGGGDD